MKVDPNDILRTRGADGLRAAIDVAPPETIERLTPTPPEQKQKPKRASEPHSATKSGGAEHEIVAKLAGGAIWPLSSPAPDTATAGFPANWSKRSAALNQLARRRAPDFERLRARLKAETKVRFAALEAVMKAEAATSDPSDDGVAGRPLSYDEILSLGRNRWTALRC